MPHKVQSRTYLHSAYVKDIGTGDDAVVISEIVEYEDGETEPKLRLIKSPKTRFWITQEAYRTHPDKKEFESLALLDEYVVPYKDKDQEIFKILKGYTPNYITPKQRRELQQSPYLYGGNINIEASIAMKYKTDLTKSGKVLHTPTTGFLDIEQSLLESSYGVIPIITFVAENKVFLAMHKGFMTEERDGKRVDVTVDHVLEQAKLIIDPMVEQLFTDNAKDLGTYKHRMPFTYEFFVGESEVELIKWTFDKVHETKTSFVGIWNLGFDIGEIIKVLDRNNIPLEEVFADPSLRGSGYAYANYREDKRDVAHFTQKWHWLTATAHAQFVDSMALYSYIRQVDGKETSYALDDILKKFNLGGKLKVDQVKELEGLQTADWHRAMLSRFFTAYALYAMWDAMSLQLLEWRNNDLTSMLLLSDTTPAKFFPNQTIRVTNTLFQDWLPEKQILGTGVDIEAVRDSDLITEGGACLEPQNLIAKGLKLFQEWPNHATQCFAWLNDFDFSAQYPSAIVCMNISKQTKLSTIFSIKADHVQKRYSPSSAVEIFCSYLITPSSNAVELGVEFFELPDYQELTTLFETHLKQN